MERCSQLKQSKQAAKREVQMSSLKQSFPWTCVVCALTPGEAQPSRRETGFLNLSWDVTPTYTSTTLRRPSHSFLPPAGILFLIILPPPWTIFIKSRAWGVFLRKSPVHKKKSITACWRSKWINDPLLADETNKEQKSSMVFLNLCS